MSGVDRTEELREMKKVARQSGGPERIAARRRDGVGSARERVERLAGPDTFVELDVFIEGAVTGHGKVAGRDMYVFSEDPDVSRNALGAEFARKAAKVADLARVTALPWWASMILARALRRRLSEAFQVCSVATSSLPAWCRR